MEDQIPKHLPIKIKMKKEKEKAFKDLKNEKWMRDFELEVTNTGDKPIYFLSLVFTMPEMIAPDGNKMGFSLNYGRNWNISTPPKPEDVPIRPGETYVFKIPEHRVKDWEWFSHEENKPQPKKILIEFNLLNFGDGTGFNGSGGFPVHRTPKAQGSTGRCVQESNKSDPKSPMANWRLPTLSYSLGLSSLTTLPVSFLPANFWSTASLSPTSIKLSPQPGNDCSPAGCKANGLTSSTKSHISRLG